MKKKTIYTLGAIAFGVSFLGILWWGCWFLRLGPNGPNGWAFLPVLITSMAALAAVFVLAFMASETL